MRHLTRIAASLLAPLALAACAGPLNNEHGIGNAGRPFGRSIFTPATLADGLPPVPAEGFEPTTDQQNAPVYGAAGPVDARSAQPSLVALDRSNWGSTSIDVPNNFPAHQPRFTTNYLIKDSNPRAQGKYPNERTALAEGTDRHNDEQILEAAAAPFVVAGDMLMLLPRAVAELRWGRPTRTGSEPYARMPSDVVIVNPSVEPRGNPSRLQSLPPKTKGITDPGAAPIPAAKPRRALQPPADELRPGGGMPASNIPQPAPQPVKP